MTLILVGLIFLAGVAVGALVDRAIGGWTVVGKAVTAADQAIASEATKAAGAVAAKL